MLATARRVVAAAASTAPHRTVSSSVPLRALSASASEAAAQQAPETTSAIPGRRTIGAPAAVALASLSLATGYAIGCSSSSSSSSSSGDSPNQTSQQQPHVLPSGLPRSCCSCESSTASSSPASASSQQLTDEQRHLPTKLQSIVGKENVLSGSLSEASSAPYLKGARLGQGSALAIVKPQTIQEAIDCLKSIVDAGCTVIPQGANTGLTGGSTPRDDGGDGSDKRPAVVISMRDLDVAFPIDDGKRVVCLAGTGISDLSAKVASWFSDRESHSVLGSMFLNPTTAAGVAYGSGGTQLRKGPARTDRALYAKVSRDKWGENVIAVVNTLGIDGIEDTDFQPGKGSVVEQLDMYARDVKEGYRRSMGKSSKSKFGTAQASDAQYPQKVCRDDGSVSRFNADTEGEDCNRSEGKVLILATVHDTFPKPEQSKTYWVSFAVFETSLAFRREVCLDNPSDLPVSVEYMDRDSFDVVDGAGRVMGNLIKIVGAGSIMGKLWQLKLWIEALPFNGAPLFCDKVLFNINGFTPALLPSRIMDAGRKMDHHVAMTIGEFGDGTMDRVLERMDKFVEDRGEDKIKVYECSGSGEETSLMAFRFVAAAAFRTWCVGNGKQGISIDYALPKNGGAVPALGKDDGEASSQPIPVKRMRYSHFGCNVVHEDLAYEAGVDVHSAKMALKKSVEHKCQGKLPAEHGHGTEYHAPEEAQQRWKKMDPLNVFNPGVGGLSTKFRYQD